MNKYLALFLFLFLLSSKNYGAACEDDSHEGRTVAIQLLSPVVFRGKVFSPSTKRDNQGHLWKIFNCDVAKMIAGLDLVKVFGPIDLQGYREKTEEVKERSFLEVIRSRGEEMTVTYYGVVPPRLRK